MAIFCQQFACAWSRLAIC